MSPGSKPPGSMVAPHRTDVENALWRRDHHARISRNCDPMSLWHNDLRVYIEKDYRLQDGLQSYAQKFVKMGIANNFVLSILTDYMWHCLFVMWQSVTNNEIPKLRSDVLHTSLTRRCEQLQIQLQSCRALWLAELSAARSRILGTRYATHYEQIVHDLIPEDPSIYFEPEDTMTSSQKEFFRLAIEEKISRAVLRGAEASKDEIKEHIAKVARAQIRLEDLQTERDNIEQLYEKQKRMLLNLASGGEGNAIAELLASQEECAALNTELTGLKSHTQRVENQLSELQAEYDKLQASTADFARAIKEANERNAELTGCLEKVQAQADDLAEKLSQAKEIEAERDLREKEKDEECAGLKEHISHLEVELQAAIEAAGEGKIEELEKELEERNGEIAKLEVEIEAMTQKMAQQGSMAGDHLKEVEEEVSNLRLREEEHLARIEELCAQKEQLESVAEQMKQEQAAGRSSNDGIISAYEEKIRNAEDTMSTQKQALEAAQAKLDEYVQEANTIRDMLLEEGEWQELISRSRNSVQDLRQEIFVRLSDTCEPIHEPTPVIDESAVEEERAKTEEALNDLQTARDEMEQLKAQMGEKDDLIQKADAQYEKEKEKGREALAAMSSVKGENKRLTLALEELHKRFEEMREMMASKGVDVAIVDAALEQSGLADLVRGDKTRRKVFDRLYGDAMSRLHRREETRQRILQEQQEELHQVLHVLITPRMTPPEKAQEVFDDFYKVLEKYPQGRAALGRSGARILYPPLDRDRSTTSRGAPRAASPPRPSTSPSDCMRGGGDLFASGSLHFGSRDGSSMLIAPRESSLHIGTRDLWNASPTPLDSPIRLRRSKTEKTEKSESREPKVDLIVPDPSFVLATERAGMVSLQESKEVSVSPRMKVPRTISRQKEKRSPSPNDRRADLKVGDADLWLKHSRSLHSLDKPPQKSAHSASRSWLPRVQNETRSNDPRIGGKFTTSVVVHGLVSTGVIAKRHYGETNKD